MDEEQFLRNPRRPVRDEHGKFVALTPHQKMKRKLRRKQEDTLAALRASGKELERVMEGRR